MDINEKLQDLDDYLTDIKEKLDETSRHYGNMEALVNHNKEVKEGILNKCKLKHEGSDARQKTLATQEEEYKEFLLKKYRDEAEFFMLKYQKQTMEKAIDALRTAISFFKNRVSQDV